MTNEERNIVNQAIAILRNELTNTNISLTSPDDTRRLVITELALEESEVFMVLFLTAQHQLISADKMFFGTIDGASVYPREIVKAVLKHNAATVIFAHNHPSGNSQPSQADKQITWQLRDTLKLLNVRVLDHLIVGGADCTSFAELGLL